MAWATRKNRRRKKPAPTVEPKRRTSESGARAAGHVRGWRMRISAYLSRHGQVFFYSLGRLYRNRYSSLLTIAVIGIALALPTGMYVLLMNLQKVSGDWNRAAQISLFLKQSLSDARAEKLAAQLRAWPEITTVRVITHAQSLAEFERLSGFGNALKTLGENPLPAVLVIRPSAAYSQPDAVRHLLTKLRSLNAGMAELDMQWLKRLFALMAIGQRAVLVIGALLGLAVLLVVGNTIRLDIQNRRDEIEVTKLIGANDAFIRRPFLYHGLWYGLFGGLAAWLLVDISLWLLQGPTQRLAQLYRSGFELASMNGSDILWLLGFSGLLGWLGAWLAVSRHLHEIEPT